MSDYHVLTARNKRNAVTVAFHIEVPDTGVNAAEIQWRDVLKSYRAATGGAISVVPAAMLGDGEQTALTNGALLEAVQEVRFSANASDEAKVLAVNAKHADLATSEITRLGNKLQFWGVSGNVA